MISKVFLKIISKSGTFLDIHGLIFDISGENILLTQSGHVRITDFGSSRMVRNGENLQGMEGSPSNVPPEMITENGNIFNLLRDRKFETIFNCEKP